LFFVEYESRWTLKFGYAICTMSFNGKSNFQLALENKDKAMLIKLIDYANQLGISSKDLFLQSFGQTPFDLMRNAIKEQNEATVVFLLDLVGTKTFPFEDEAMLLKEGFQGLWLEYRALLEQKIRNKTLEWTTCELEIPIDVFKKDANVGARVGTSDSMTKWLEAVDQGHVFTYWRSQHSEHLKETGRGWSNTTTTTIVVFFTIANICKIGLNGIIRFLLMQGAPLHMFKTPLLKWVITFKWERVWKKRSLKKFVYYLCFMVLYSMYSIWIAFSSNDLGKDKVTSTCLTTLIVALMVVSSMLIHQEYVQMKTYIKDGKTLFHDNRIWGVRQYLSSLWNIVEVLSYLILVLVIPALHFSTLGGVDVSIVLYMFVALETLLIWIKVTYFFFYLTRAIYKSHCF